MPAKVPLSVIMGNGNSAHLTKKEIEERMRTEIKAPSDNIKAPGYLSVGQKKKFNEVAEELKRIDIMTNLDIDTLARFVIADTLYIEITKPVSYTHLTLPTKRIV